MQVRHIIDTMDDGPSLEAADGARAWLDAHRGDLGPFLENAFSSPGDDASDVSNPATGERLARVARGSEAQVDAAVAAAARAFPAWSSTPGHLRARHLQALARLVRARERFLAVLETLETGRPIRRTRDVDVPLAARHLAHHAGWAELCASEFPGHVASGVSAQVIARDSPLLALAREVAPALAAGNTVVLKPHELTPLTALAFAEICRDAGLPPGVVNVVPGDGATGATLVRHPGVARVAFAGSGSVGRAIRTATAGSGVALSLQHGGRSTIVVFADADLDAAVEGVVDGVWSGGGPMRGTGARLLVQEGVAGRFVAKLHRRMASLRVGDPLDGSTDVGAVTDPARLRRIRDLVAAAAAEGAELWQVGAPLPAAGCFSPPTLLAGVEPASTCGSAEIPGPVATMTTFRTPPEAAALADGLPSGGAASVWSQDIDLALDMAMRVRAGTVWINAVDLVDAAAGFGGTGDGGFGRDGGRDALEGELTPPPAPRVTAAMGPGAGPPGRASPGSRQDVAGAVAAAVKGTGWSAASAHHRSQVLHHVAEVLSARAREFADRLSATTGASEADSAREVEAALRRTAFYAAWADKLDGRVPAARARHMVLALDEPFGVMGLVCPDAAPLLALVSLLMPALAAGNRAVAVPSTLHPSAAIGFAGVLDASGVPAGAVSIVTGERESLAKVLAEHGEVSALWYFGPTAGAAAVERAVAGNMKPTWVDDGPTRDWFDEAGGQGRAFLRRATRAKTVWMPYGE